MFQEFRLKHFAGDVTYNTKGFLDKNNDLLFRDLKEVQLQSFFYGEIVLNCHSPNTIAIITVKFKQRGLTIEKFVYKVEIEWQTVSWQTQGHEGSVF